MLGRKRSEPKPSKVQLPSTLRNAYGHTVAREETATSDVVETQPRNLKTSDYARRATPVAKPREMLPIHAVAPRKRKRRPRRGTEASTDADGEVLWAHMRAIGCCIAGCEYRHDDMNPIEIMHGNWGSTDGKGMGLKAYWWNCAPGCRNGHRDIDSGSKLSFEERRERWIGAWFRVIGELFRLGLIRPAS